ncbi:MAG: hypothetical protein ACE5DQ_00590 [Candidatus Paceibacterota bacterium]
MKQEKHKSVQMIARELRDGRRVQENVLLLLAKLINIIAHLPPQSKYA